MIFAVRLFHGLISAFFLVCLVYVYYAGFTDQSSQWSTLAAIALIIEGVILVSNGWNCPLEHIHRRYGDQKTFFELFFPTRIAEQVIPTVSVLAVVGLVLLVL